MDAVTPQPPSYGQDKIGEQKYEPTFEEENGLKQGEVSDAFGNEEYAEIKYKTLKWWYVVPQVPMRFEIMLTRDAGNVVCVCLLSRMTRMT